jgi:hypothetical protein
MNYVEWLRIRNVLKVTAIVLTVFFLIAAIVRVSLNKEIFDREDRHGAVGQSSVIAHDPGTKIVTKVLPNGTKRIFIDDPAKQTHIVVDQNGDGRAVTSGGMSVTTSEVTGMFLFGVFVALVVATVLAAPFAHENNGHLNITWTKPIARERLALAIMGVDVVGILAAFALGVVTAIASGLLFGRVNFATTSQIWEILAGSLAITFAWYALLNAVTASLRRGYGIVLGLAWPVALLVTVLGTNEKLRETTFGAILHAIFWPISRLDPIAYANGPGDELAPGAFVAAIVMILAYGALAIVQWRRVEA